MPKNTVGSTAPMRVLVTGGAGFLGSHLCERLVNDGHHVVCVDNLSTGITSNVEHLHETGRFTFQQHDITESFTVAGPVDCVFHLASPASPDDYSSRPKETLRVGSVGTFTALEIASEKAARFVYTSSSEVYGDPKIHPQEESYWGNVNPIGPRSMYDEAKRFGEALATCYRTHDAVNTGIVRLFNTYGPRMRANDGRMVPNFIHQSLAGKPITIYGSGRQTRSLCFVDDTVEALTRMAAVDHPGPVNIGNPIESTVLATAELIREICGSRSPISSLPSLVDDPQLRRPDIRLARDVLGWTPSVGPRDGLTRTVEWFSGRSLTPSPVGTGCATA
jgi:dTDP-glucose 4,6-dehydratase